MTCQHGNGFPYTPLVQNLTLQDPDILYFSGDQIYEGNGGYGIIRFPADKAILSYLGKWYMFGWAFGDLMRVRPTICTPDDHDVFQGNIWGAGGKSIPIDRFRQFRGTGGGFIQPPDMIKAVYQTQCSHLPDPYNPQPMEQGLPVFYTDMVYGRIGFAVITDRIFKSGPAKVAFWSGRQDHVKEELPDMSVLDRSDLELLGDRQEKFLEDWIQDWRGTDMKVVLSQTVLANIATHHGANQMMLYADLDSGGWPRSARNRAVDLFRKAFALHIVGDQHVPSLSQYGINDHRDAGWCYCTPAIFVGYERRFLPERLGWNITQRPEHGHPNTGLYKDPFGNLQYVYAIGNPVDKPVSKPRYQHGQDKSSGYGLVRFDQKKRSMDIHAYRFKADLSKPESNNEFPGWPKTIHQLDNYNRKAKGYLPTLRVKGMDNPVILITNERDGKLEYAIRLMENQFTPKVFTTGSFTVKMGDPDKNRWKIIEHLNPVEDPDNKSMEISF
jgi:hypothetical protein